jgi:hypothetical protein
MIHDTGDGDMAEADDYFDKALNRFDSIHSKIGVELARDAVIREPEFWVAMCTLTEQLNRAARDARSRLPQPPGASQNRFT